MDSNIQKQQKPSSFLSKFCCGSKYSRKKPLSNQQQQQQQQSFIQKKQGEQQRQTHQTGISIRQTSIMQEEDQFAEESKNYDDENKNLQIIYPQSQQVVAESHAQAPQGSGHKECQSSQFSNSNSNHYYTMSNELFTLKTKYAIHQIDYVEVRPADKTFQSYFIFDCPICFRHFNKILKSACCDHYLCHYCLRDIYIKGNDNENFEYRCMFCQKQLPEYIDADDHPHAIKKYFDSPFVTPKEPSVSGRGDNTVVPFKVDSNSHNIHSSNNNNLINFQEEEDEYDDINKENKDMHINQIHDRNIQNQGNKHSIVRSSNIVPPHVPPLPHILKNLLQQSNLNQSKEQQDKNIHQENEDINFSEHINSASIIPEFQNKYHSSYLKHSNSANLQNNAQREQNENGSEQLKQIKYVR